MCRAGQRSGGMACPEGRTCKHCERDPDESPDIKQYLEHWVHIVTEIERVMGDISVMEERLNRMTQDKRMFQKLFEQRWGASPPETPARLVKKQWHGYIADQVMRVASAEESEMTRTRSSASSTSMTPTRQLLQRVLNSRGTTPAGRLGGGNANFSSTRSLFS
jgi:hypothetical protein